MPKLVIDQFFYSYYVRTRCNVFILLVKQSIMILTNHLLKLFIVYLLNESKPGQYEEISRRQSEVVNGAGIF